MIDAKVPVTFSWSELRRGIIAVQIPVYKIDQSVSSLTDKQIQQLQKDPKADKQLMFTVKLDLQYFRSIFYPTVVNIEGLASHENLSSDFVLNFQVPGTSQNFMQLLNSSAPSLLQQVTKAEGADLTRACSTALSKLKSAGLDDVDSSIVMKSFVDEAKGGADWYSNPALVKSCFSQALSIQSNLEKIYGKPAQVGIQTTTP